MEGGPKTKVRRLPQRQVEDPAFLRQVLDEGFLCHVGFMDEGQPYVIPTGYVRDGERLLLHGSRASRMMRHLAAGRPACICVTHLDGLVFARSAFHHSMNYRSAVLFGAAREVQEGPPTREALRVYMERLVPGRWEEARPPNAHELAATVVVEFPIDQASCKARLGPPGDEPEDLAWPAWAGVVPLRLERGAPEPFPPEASADAPQHVRDWRPRGPRALATP